jgi:hypothetical protein
MADKTLRDGVLLVGGAAIGAALATYLRTGGTPSGKVKFTGLTQNIWAKFRHLIEISSQNTGPTCEFWANPVNFRLLAAAAAQLARPVATGRPSPGRVCH